MAVIVHTMGTRLRWTIPVQLAAQLRLAHDLREDLVSLEHDYEERVRAIWSGYPEVAAAEALAGERARLRTKRSQGRSPIGCAPPLQTSMSGHRSWIVPRPVARALIVTFLAGVGFCGHIASDMATAAVPRAVVRQQIPAPMVSEALTLQTGGADW